MKNGFKTLSVLAVGLASCALLCQQAQGAVIVQPVFNPALASVSELASVTGAAIPPSITVSWEVVGGPGAYTYYYNVNDPVGEVTGLGTPETIDHLNVTFLSTPANVTAVGGGLLGILNAGVGVDWIFGPIGPGTSSGWLWFTSPDAPILGNANAADGTTPSPWTTVLPGGQLVPVPNVPDGGMTLSLLGFALMGVEGLRRKLGK